jgi:alcohol dehydrogenase YqhD (iron-dependent ADH family)
MENFTIYNPTKVFFGNNALEKLPSQAKLLGTNVLLVYGKGSIKTNGIYEKVITLLKDFTITEFEGIKSNPVIEDVNAAAKLAREISVDMIIAVGGGSVIDSAKVISVAQHYDCNAWDIMTGKIKATKATPVLAVLTLAATGTEMNAFAVVQNHETREKIGWGIPPLTYPKASFLDPNLTFSVPRDYTAYGLADMVAHCLEAYFGQGNSPLTDAFIFSNIREIIEISIPLLNDLTNYQLRSRALFAGTNALNGLLTQGKTSADWGVHSLGHVLSLLYDMPHGASLTIAYPAWLKLHSEKLNDKILKLGQEVFGANSVDETITLFEVFFYNIGCPINCEQIGIEKPQKQEIIDLFIKNRVEGVVHKLSDSDRQKVLDLMFTTD